MLWPTLTVEGVALVPSVSVVLGENAHDRVSLLKLFGLALVAYQYSAVEGSTPFAFRTLFGIAQSTKKFGWPPIDEKVRLATDRRAGRHRTGERRGRIAVHERFGWIVEDRREGHVLRGRLVVLEQVHLLGFAVE